MIFSPEGDARNGELAFDRGGRQAARRSRVERGPAGWGAKPQAVLYRGHLADQGDLGSMRTLNSKARGVDLIAEGHALRYTKQMALRGNARN